MQCGGLAVALARGLLAAAVLEVVLGLRGHAEFGYSDNYNYKNNTPNRFEVSKESSDDKCMCGLVF